MKKLLDLATSDETTRILAALALGIFLFFLVGLILQATS